MSEVTNCHYVSRMLTKPWEDAARRLHYFDLRTETFGDAPSRELFALPGLNTTATERALHRRVEDSVGKYKQACEKNGWNPIDAPDERMTSALIGMIGLQVQRAREALAPEGCKFKLDELLAESGGFEWFVNDLSRDFQLIAGGIPVGNWMCFPSLGYFMLPVIGEAPAQVVPLTPRVFVTLFPREAPTGQLSDMVKTPHMVSTFSMLGGGLEHKIVLPAQIVENSDPAALTALVKSQRVDGRRLYNLIGKASAVAGLRAYGYDL